MAERRVGEASGSTALPGEEQGHGEMGRGPLARFDRSGAQTAIPTTLCLAFHFVSRFAIKSRVIIRFAILDNHGKCLFWVDTLRPS